MCKRIITTIACLFAAFSVVFAAGPQKKIHTIGDATMFEDEADVNTDKRGWVQMLQQYFTDNVSINNRGKSGASSKSFYVEAPLWQSLLKGSGNTLLKLKSILENKGVCLHLLYAHSFSNRRS